jgi:hypothetical protein
MRRGKQVFFYILMIVLVCFIAYPSMEIAVRIFDLPDRELIRSIEKNLFSLSRTEGYFDWEAPIYGWDQDWIIDSSSDLSSSMSGIDYTVLFIGDSVTRGFGVDIHKEAYPILLFKVLAANINVRVLNVAVQAFGVDQMILKLEELVPKSRPDLIVFAYVPVDLWRPARNVNYGYTKPVLVSDESKNWKVIPAPNIKEFYEDYSNAKRRFYLSLWSLSHLASNRRYYFPRFYKKYYQSLFQEIRRRLIALAEQYDVKILVVRLASTWPGAPVPFLDRVAQDTFAVPADLERFYYLDSEECVRAKSLVLGIDYAKEFRFHPTPIGHKIYADCLVDPLKASLFAPRR